MWYRLVGIACTAALALPAVGLEPVRFPADPVAKTRGHKKVHPEWGRCMNARVPALIAVNERTFCWRPVPGAQTYDAVLGSITDLRDTEGNFILATTACIQSQQPQLCVRVDDDPFEGEGDWMLVRTADPGAKGSYDSGCRSQIESRDEEIDAAGSEACP